MRNRAPWLLAIVCILTAAAPGRAGAPLADRLPPETMIYAGWGGRSLTFDGSMFGQLLNEPAAGEMLGSLHDALLRDIRDEKGRQLFQRAWRMAKIGWQHPLALALVSLEAGPEGPKPRGYILVDLGKDREAFAKQLDEALDMLADEIPLTEGTAGTVTYRTHKPRGGPAISLGYLGNVLFLAVGDDAVPALAAVAPAKSLATDEAFAARLAALGEGDAQLAYYVDVVAVAAAAKKLSDTARARGEAAPGETEDLIERITAAAGLDRVSAVAATMRVVERGLYTHARIFTPAPHRGVLLPLAGTPLTDADLASVPPDADIVLAGRVAPSATYEELRRAVKAIDPEADKEFAAELGEAEDELGLSVTGDLLDNLGDTWVVSSAPSWGGFLTGTLITVQAKDPEKLQAGIDKLVTAVGKQFPPPPEGEGRRPVRTDVPRFRTVKAGRTDVHYVSYASRREPWPVAPAWALHKGRLYIAAYPQVIQSAIAAGGGKSLTADDAFRKVRSKLAGKPSILCYTNGGKIVRQLYHWALIGWTIGANAAAGEARVEVRPDWLPPLPTVEKYVSPQISAVSADAKGVSFESYGSMPSPGFLAAAVFSQATPWVLMPSIEQARREARTAKQTADLRMLAMGLIMYEVDKGRMPDSLEDKALAKYIDGPPIKALLASGRVRYYPPHKSGNKDLRDPRRILMVMPGQRGEGVSYVAFADGRVTRLPDRQVREALANQAGRKDPADKPE